MRSSRRHFLTSAAAATLFPARQAWAQAPTLIRKPIPSSGETLPVIGIGTARRYDSVQGDAALATLRDTLRRFAAAGGSVIDTAPSYGDAESVLGALIEPAGLRDSLFLATKVGTDAREAALPHIENSFRRLRTKRIDLIAVHNLRDVATQLRTLRELKQAGRIRYVGITTSFD